MKLKPQYRLIVLVAVAMGAITLLILPSTFFDSGQSFCVSVLVFNIHCPGCGMTRAIQHLIHFEFDIAYEYNKLSFIVFPLIIYMYFWEWGRVLKELKVENL